MQESRLTTKQDTTEEAVGRLHVYGLRFGEKKIRSRA